MDGVLPVVAQHHRSGEILMVGFANHEAVQKTLETGHGWFFSRSRQRLWEKGESSGHYLDLKAVRVDCDADALIYLCEPHGPTCHTGEASCFFRTLDEIPAGETSGEAAAILFNTIEQRKQQGQPGSACCRRCSMVLKRIAAASPLVSPAGISSSVWKKQLRSPVWHVGPCGSHR